MARLAPTTSNTRGASNINKFKLETKGDAARAILIEFGSPDASDMPYGSVASYVHYLRVNTPKGSPEPPDAFVGSVLCSGDHDVVDQVGADPENCVVCAAGIRSVRRHAINLVIYQTQPGGSMELALPHQVELKPWAFGDNIFTDITALHSEWGDLRMRDVKIELVPRGNFSTYRVSILNDSKWNENDQLRASVIEVYKNRRYDDSVLKSLLGSELSDAAAEAMLAELRRRQAAYDGAGSVMAHEPVEYGTPMFDSSPSAAPPAPSPVVAPEPVGVGSVPAPSAPTTQSLDDLLKG